MKYDIFVSYSRRDSAIVNTFVERFRQEGYSVWMDKDGVETSDEFKHVIVEAIDASSIFVYFSSKNANKSDWTAKEIGIAVQKKKNIMPVKLDDSPYSDDVMFDLVNIDYIDYYTKKGKNPERLEKLLRAIAKKIGRRKEQQSPLQYSEQITVKTTVTGSIFTTTLVCKITGFIIGTFLLIGFVGIPLVLFELYVLYKLIESNEARDYNAINKYLKYQRYNIYALIVISCITLFIGGVIGLLNT